MFTLKPIHSALILWCAATLPTARYAHALTFNLTEISGPLPAQVVAGFNTAAARWSNYFSDNVTINIDIGYSSLSPGVLGSAQSFKDTYTYSAVRSAIDADKTSPDDNTAAANLPMGAAVNMMLNYTSNSPMGANSATPYLDSDSDANNTTIRLNDANAKALGLSVSNPKDASITFSSDFSFDFDPSNGVTAGQYDFVGVATHEIGHALGFVSGVDILDSNSSGFPDNAFTYLSSADLFRFSSVSFAQGAGTIDWTANTTAKYFSIDGGATTLYNFSTGVTHGDGNQASHWKDNQSIGIMDPTAAPGELLAISSNDLRLFDVIGWNLASIISSTPEPPFLGVLAAGSFLSLLASRRSRTPHQTIHLYEPHA